MTFEQLQQSILHWADQKGLITHENAPKQFMKFIEESGELASALLKKNTGNINQEIEDEIDAFGDVLVTLIILSDQRGLDLVTCLGKAYNVIKDRKGKTVNGTFIKE
jgi:NTP pyrophosphatase (non-canonical NTP hydrolase)